MKLSIAATTALLGASLASASNSTEAADAQRMTKRAKASTSKATVYSTCSKPGTFALTFDDGPYIYESKLVKFLNSQGVKATFFVNGANFTQFHFKYRHTPYQHTDDCVYDRAESLQAAYSAGHLIGSHTWSHADITTLSKSQLQAELGKVEVALGKILGVKPALFRPPYGAYDDQSLKNLAALGYNNAIYWNFDSGDSVGKSAAQSKADYKSYIGGIGAKSTTIALNHETYQTTVDEVIPYAVKLIKAKKLKMVTVADCLGLTPYQSQTGVLGKRDSTWKC